MADPAAEARALREQHWNEEGMIKFPVDPYYIARRLGVRVDHQVLPADTAGFIIRENGGQTNVYLNRADPEIRKRFTMAHELGHLMQYKDEPTMGFVDKRDEVSASGTDPRERWANSFAAELLMPAATLNRWWAEGRSADEIRKRLDVSKPALAYRLQNLGLLNG